MDTMENNIYIEVNVEAISENSHNKSSKSMYNDSNTYSEKLNQETELNVTVDKNSAIWTTSATAILLELYKCKVEMLETPNRKTAMWNAISESLKDYDIDMTPNQVRWKINALTQKYKQCIDSGHHNSFKYFKELDDIYSDYYNEENNTITEFLQKKRNLRVRLNSSFNESSSTIKSAHESRSMIELRKIRLANRIDADISQSKIHIEKQWLEYLRRQEEHKLLKDDLFDRHIKLREEELELRKQELEFKETIEFKKLEMKEKDQEEMLRIEREKCEVLKFIAHKK